MCAPAWPIFLSGLPTEIPGVSIATMKALGASGSRVFAIYLIQTVVLAGLGGAIIGSIGPVCTVALREAGIAVDLEPSHPKMGVLMKEVSEQVASLFDRKR